jgi:hypothetical protein
MYTGHHPSAEDVEKIFAPYYKTDIKIWRGWRCLCTEESFTAHGMKISGMIR